MLFAGIAAVPAGLIEVSKGCGGARGFANCLLAAIGQTRRRIDVGYVVVVDCEQRNVDDAVGFDVAL